MKLKGIARASELPEIFHMLSSNDRHGVLEVSKNGAVRKVYFGPQGVKLFYESGRTRNLLGQILVGKGIIAEKALHAALKVQKASQRPLGEILCDSGAAKQRNVEEALTYQLREELFDLLTWEDAQFEFHEGAQEPKESGRSYLQAPHFNPNAIIMEAARRADEWKRIREVIRSEHSVLLRDVETVELNGEQESDELTLRVLSLADGARSMGSMLDALRLSEFDVYESAHGLLNAGAVKLASAKDLADLGARALDAGECERARRLLVNAAALCGDDFELRYDVGTMLLWAGADEDAHKQLDVVLGKLIEDGFGHRVVEMLDHIHSDFPDSPYSCERRLKLLDPAKDFDKALSLARELMAIYTGRGDTERASRMLKHLSRFRPTRPEDFIALGEFLESSGEKKSAARQFVEAARKLRFRRRDAIRLYRRAIQLDPKLDMARRELSEIDAAPGRHRRWVLRAAAWAAVLVLAALGVRFLWNHEAEAEQDLDRLNTRVQGHLARREYDEALEAYRVFLARHPWTAAAARVHKDLEEVRIDRDAAVAARSYTLDRILCEAEAAEKHLDLATAAERYRELIRFAVTDELTRKGQDNLRRLTDEMRDFLACLARARRYETEKDYQKALESCLEARERSPRLFERDGIRLPLHVESTPAGASVSHDSSEMGTTPLLLRRHPDATVTLRLHRDGYADASLVISPDDRRASFDVTLNRRYLPVWTFRTEGVVDEVPSVVDDVCCFSTRRGRVYAATLGSGARRWEHALDVVAGSYVSAPLVVGDRVLVATMTGRVHALSLATGRELWCFKGQGTVSGPPVYLHSEGLAVVVYADGTVVWLDPKTGEMKRTRRLPGGVAGPVLLLDDVVCYGTSDRTVSTFDLNAAKTLWQKGVRVPVEQSMTSAENLLFVRFDPGRLLALSLSDGELAWSFATDGGRVTAPSTDGSRFYVATDRGTLCALDARRGELAWRATLDGPVHTRPTVAGGRVYVGTEERTLWAFDATDGTLLWKTGLSGVPAAPVSAAGKWILVTTGGGTLEAFER